MKNVSTMSLIGKAMGKSLNVESFEDSAGEYNNGNGNGLHRSIVVNH